MIPDYLFHPGEESKACTIHSLVCQPDALLTGRLLHNPEQNSPPHEVDHAVLFTCPNCKYMKRVVFNPDAQPLYVEEFTWSFKQLKWIWVVSLDLIALSREEFRGGESP